MRFAAVEKDLARLSGNGTRRGFEGSIYSSELEARNLIRHLVAHQVMRQSLVERVDAFAGWVRGNRDDGRKVEPDLEVENLIC